MSKKQKVVWESRKISDWAKELDRLREVNAALLAACEAAMCAITRTRCGYPNLSESDYDENVRAELIVVAAIAKARRKKAKGPSPSAPQS